jgi:hypothetical protein
MDMNSLSDADESRRDFLIYLLSIGALAAIPGCNSGGVIHTLDTVEAMPPGKSIYQFMGDVRVNGQPADLSTIINPGDTVETLELSYIIFVVNKDAFILRANSRMVIPVPTAPTNTIQLTRGKLLSVLASRKIAIKTPSAFVSIRGTGIYVESDPEGSYVCTCYGIAELTTPDNPAITETVSATHHDSRYILADPSAANRIQVAPFRDHEDEELLLIETLVGRTTPFVVPKSAVRSRRSYY